MYRAKLKDVKQNGLGNIVHKPRIDSKDLKKMYESLDLNTASGLQKKSFWMLLFISVDVDVTN